MENQISAADSINRRKFTRFGFTNDFFLETEKFQIIPNTYSKNISQKGALLVINRELAIGSILSIEIPSAKLQLIAEVRWIEPATEKTYNVGVAFHVLFPQTQKKISEFIDELEATVTEENEGTFLSLNLELSISSFLDHYIDEIRSDSVPAISSARRHSTSLEKSYSFFTPSKSRTLDYTSTSFRLDDEKTTEVHATTTFSKFLAASAALVTILAVLGFQTGLIQKSIPFAKSLIEKPMDETVTQSAITAGETMLGEGALEKVSWKGADDHLDITFSFREPITEQQVEFSRINIDEPRELIKIFGVEGKLDQKTISLSHPLASQIRLGLHENQLQSDLHIVIDVGNPNISISNKMQDSNSLTIRLQ